MAKPKMKAPELNLYSEVLERLETANPVLGKRFSVQFNVNNAPSIEEQIAKLNEFWRLQLGLLTVDTMSARMGLADVSDPYMWLRNFDRYVFNAIVKYELPFMTAFG